MNYRHIYHAGNGCDVVKHAILALLMQHLRGKDKPFAVLDTHAGCGLYDLADERALKTNEATAGVKLVWEAFAGQDVPDFLRPYLDCIAALNAGAKELRYYPGSPSIARKMMREGDRLIACELHPEDSQELRRLFWDDPQAQIHHRDGYAALKAMLPFPEKRGLVLIDPPFETTDEIEKLVQAVRFIHERMAQTVVGIWYPIKERPAIWQFHEALVSAGLPKMLAAEFMFHPETRHDRLNGSGLIVVNTPWKLDEQMAHLFNCLHEVMKTESQASTIKALTSL